MPPVSDPENWNWTTFSFAPMIGFAMHNTAYRVTVQWRYGVYMKGPRGPFQTSITINVQNLVVTSSDETKVLKWDPVRGIADTTFSYSLECAQRKWCQVRVSIYSTNGMKVYEEWLEQIAPGSYSFTWDGSVNVVPPPPPDGKAPAGLYVFDIGVIGIAPGYDEDCIRSEALYIGDHDIVVIGPNLYRVGYVLHSERDAFKSWVDVWDPLLTKIAGPVYGGVHAISPNAAPKEGDGNFVDINVFLEYGSDNPYRFVIWAQDNFYDVYKNHKNKFAIVNQARKPIGRALITGHYYPKNWGPWREILRELNSTKFVDELEKMLKDVVAEVKKVGKRWFIFPNWQVTLIAEYSTTARFQNGMQVNFKYKTDERATEFRNLLQYLCYTSGTHVVHFWGHAGPGLIAFPSEQTNVVLFGICSANPNPQKYQCEDIYNVLPQYPKPFVNIRVVYLGGCRSFLPPSLPQAFVDRGAWSAVGWKVKVESSLPFRDDAPHRLSGIRFEVIARKK